MAKDLPNATTPDALYGRAIDELLRQREEIDRVLKDKYTRRVAILFSDIKGSTKYFEDHGDLAGRAMVQRHNDLLFPVVQACGGRVVKTIGDAIMASFDGAREAVDAAVQMQLRLSEHNAGRPAEERIVVRIGVNCGEALVDGQDVYGDTVNVAARVEAAAGPGEILVSDAVKAELGPNAPELQHRGRTLLKGKSLGVELYAVNWKEMTRRAVPLRPPEVDPRYEVAAMLGVGGMATVWRARDRRLGREVALKVLHRHLDLTPLARERFRREATIAAALHHPNIIEVYDFSSEESPESYMVMELVEGTSFRRFLEQHGPIPTMAASVIGHEVALALAAAHGRGVVHRDVKPDNVLLRNDGVVKLGDFGIAGVSELARLTLSGSAIGTPAYMPPEQAEGAPSDPHADVFSLGVMLYEAATGQLPFAAPSAPAMLRRMAEGNYDDPSEKTGPELARVIARALSRDPAMRYPTAAEMGTDLAGVLEARGIRDPRGYAARFIQSPLDPQAQVPSLPHLTVQTPSAELMARVKPKRGRVLATVLGIGLGLGLAIAAAMRLAGARSGPPGPLEPPVASTPTPASTPTSTPTSTSTSAPAPVPVATPGRRAPPARHAKREPKPAPKPPPAAVAARPALPPIVQAPPDPPPVPAPGILRIHVFPWADVYVDGKLALSGQRDYKAELPAGLHEVKLSHPGSPEWRESVLIVSGATLQRRVDLMPPQE